MTERSKPTTKAPESKSNDRAYKAPKVNLLQSKSVSTPIDHIMFLQRTVGNQAVQRILQGSGIRGQGSGVRIQPKLRIGQPNDMYEQEADRVAEQVMRMPDNTGVSGQLSGVRGEDGHIQRMCAECEEDLQRKTQNSELGDLELGSSSQEELHRQPMEEEEVVQTKPLIQRQVEPEEEEEETVQTKEVSVQTREVSPNLESQIGSLKGKGQPLPESERNFYESQFGYDFNHVRIHSDTQADTTARMLNARAFTHGHDIFFGTGQYQPNTKPGKELLAHELTHTIQQQPGRFEFTKNTIQNKHNPVITTSSNNRGRSTDGVLAERTIKDTSHEVVSETQSKDGISPESAPETKTIPERLPAHREEIPQAKTAETVAEVEPVAEVAAKSEIEPTAGGVESGLPGGVSAISGEGEEPSAQTQKPQIDTSSSEGLLDSLSNIPASSFGQAMDEVSAAAHQIQAQEKVDLKASFPEIGRPTGLPRLSERREVEETELERGEAPAAESPAPREGVPPETRHEEAHGPVPGSQISTAASEPREEEGGGSWWSWLVNRVRGFINSLPTSDPGVSTSAGSRPHVDMTGEADTAQNEQQQRASDQEVFARRSEADNARNKDFGENDIYPNVPEELLRPSYKPTQPTSSVGGGGKGTLDLPAGVGPSLDQTIAPWLSEKVNEQREKERLERNEYQAKSQEARVEGERRIAEENEKTRSEQQTMQEQARNDVNERRQKWLEENQEIQEAYSTQSEAKRIEIDQKIQDKVQTTEREADEKLTEAENTAEDERIKAETKAAEEKRKAENKPRSWWDRVKGAVSDVFNTIKKAVNIIFDGLRKVVKGIIEAAKAVVRGIIELARMAIVGFIKAFGEFVKGLVTVALAAFPDAAAKARAWIDDKVNVATDAVNRAAEALKKATDAILDFVGEVLDTVLSLYQKAYNLILDALEFIVVGLIEIMERIGHLVSAAREMPDHFWGQAQEEVIGMNLNEPLPFERTEPLNTGEAARTMEEEGVISSQDMGLMKREQLSDQDVVVDQVATLDEVPEFIMSLNLEEGQEIIFGESNDPNRTVDSIKAEALGTVPATPGPLPGREESEISAEEQITQKTPEEELQALMEQTPEGGCTKEKTGEPAKGGEVPEHMKRGPFTSSQRGRYLWHQMKQGVKQWFNCNWPWLLAAAVGALLGFIGLNILTGGAVLAALPLIMQIVGAIMIGVAMARVTAYVGEYLSQGWQGEISAAAKSLARGLAIGAIELIFALLFNLGAVIKAIKGGLKATAKAATQAVKATVITTVRNVRQLGRLGLQAGKAAIKNGKLIMKGLKSGFAKGAKSLDDLAKRLWQQVRFRKFKIRLKHPWIELLGYINPWVLVAKSQVVFVEKKDLPTGKKVGDIVDVTVSGKKFKGELVGMGAKPHYRRIADLVQGAGTADSSVIHHLIEQQTLKMDDYVKFTIEEINAPSRLIPILKGSVNEVVHLSKIRTMWDAFYDIMRTRPIDVVKNRAAVMKFADFTKEFIEEMGRFMKRSTKYKDAVKTGNEDLIKQILHEQANKLLDGGKFNLKDALDNAWKS